MDEPHQQVQVQGRAHVVYVGLPPDIPRADARGLKDKLFIYFQKKQVNPCCDVQSVSEIVDDDDSRTWFVVSFDDQSGVENVLSRSDHSVNLNGVLTALEVRGDSPDYWEDSNDSDGDESFHSAQSDDDENLTDDMYDHEVTTSPVPLPEAKQRTISPCTARVPPFTTSVSHGTHPSSPSQETRVAVDTPHTTFGFTTGPAPYPSQESRLAVDTPHTTFGFTTGPAPYPSQESRLAVDTLPTTFGFPTGPAPSPSQESRLAEDTPPTTFGFPTGPAPAPSQETRLSVDTPSTTSGFPTGPVPAPSQETRLAVDTPSTTSGFPTGPVPAPSQETRLAVDTPPSTSGLSPGPGPTNQSSGSSTSYQALPSNTAPLHSANKGPNISPDCTDFQSHNFAPSWKPGGWNTSSHQRLQSRGKDPGYQPRGPPDDLRDEWPPITSGPKGGTGQPAARGGQAQAFSSRGGRGRRGKGSRHGKVDKKLPTANRETQGHTASAGADTTPREEIPRTAAGPEDQPTMDIEKEPPDEFEIEVMCSPAIQEDLLKVYLKNSQRSGGGPIKTLLKDNKTGAFRVTYEDSQVAKQVASRSHKIGGSDIKVHLVTKRKPTPVRERCLLLQGIPDDCTSEHLLMFMENASDCAEEPKIQYGENPGTALCTFQKEIKDIDAVIKNVTSETVSGVILKAERVYESDCILVQGVTESIPVDMLKCYFSSTKRSGGRDVLKVEQGPEKGQVIVSFKDWKVVGKVLSRGQSHKVKGTNLLVEEYHVALGKLTSLDAPSPHIPKPVSVSVSAEVMKFIYGGKGQTAKQTLIAELGRERATLQWPENGDKGQARIEPLVIAGQSQSSWLTWPKATESCLKGFLSKWKSDQVPIPSPFWMHACQAIKQIDLRSIAFTTDEPHRRVALIGECSDVNRVHAEIDKIIQDLRAKAEYEAQQSRVDIPLNPLKLQQFIRCGVQEKIKQKFPRLKLNLDSQQNKVNLCFEGTRKECQEAELQMRREMDQLQVDEFKAGINKVKFVKSVHEKIHEVLGSRNIYAACSGVNDGKITIYGARNEDVRKAKAYIDQEVTEGEIPIRGSPALTVLQSQKGKQLLDGINKQRFVLTQITDISQPSGSTQPIGCLELAGFKDDLETTQKNIITFLKDNVILKRHVPASRNKVQLITSFQGTELVNITTQNARNHVKVHPKHAGRSKGFVLEGNESGLEAAIQAINQLLAKAAERQYPVSKTGMVQLFRDEKGKKFLESVQTDLQCIITEDREGNDDEEGDEVASQTATAATEVLCQFALLQGARCKLRVCKGDLTKQKVDCIVNAANMDLQHIGGLALAILNAGGQVIQQESNQIIKEKGRPLYVGEPVLTSNGRLPCKKIMHVAGPRWPQGRARTPGQKPLHEEKLLFDGITECLNLANSQGFQSLSIPAISTGVFGFPVELAASHTMQAVAEFCQRTPTPSLQEISLTNNDKPTCDVFKQAAMDQFSNLQLAMDTSSSYTIPDLEQEFAAFVDDYAPVLPPVKFTSSGQNALTTKEGVTVTLKKGSITNEVADVFVNSAGSDLNLNNGAVSKVILQAAGPALQQECTLLTNARGNIPGNTFVETGPGNLPGKKVYHCICEQYQAVASEKLLITLVHSLLKKAEVNELASIVIPALGTGNLSYPADVSARAMYEAVSQFSQQYPNAYLKDVRFVVYDKDAKTIKGFEDEISSLAAGGVAGAMAKGGAAVPRTRKLRKTGAAASMNPTGAEDRQSYSSITQSRGGLSQTKIGSVCLQLGHGNIVQETSDSIVNSVGQNLDLNGPVSQAIIKAGGRGIAFRCDQLRQKGADKLINITPAENLPCKVIFHILTPRSAEEIKTIVGKTLHYAELNQLKSISFPALGTGLGASLSEVDCASAMLQAIGQFAVSQKPRHLHLIRLIIFQANLLPGFRNALDREAGTSYKPKKSIIGQARSFISSAVGYVSGSSVEKGTAADEDDELQESMILLICAMDASCIDKATKKIDDFQDTEFLSQDVLDEDNLMDKISRDWTAQVNDIRKEHNVSIDLDKHRKIYHIQGQILHVKDAVIGMQKLFKTILKEEKDKHQNDLLQKNIQWKYQDPLGGFEPYDSEINARIEEAHQKKKTSSIKLDLDDGMVKINFSQMKEISSTGMVDILRVDVAQASGFETPSNWIPMTQKETCKAVKLLAGTPEYINVESQIKVGRGRQIVEIQRIQNKELMNQYQARKRGIADRLGRPNIEECLFHGTDEATCAKINRAGFNRSFCGKNATVFGNGTYFAVDPQYSIRDQYSQPNGQGVKHIYLCKVLVGDYTTGSQGVIAPPSKPNNADQLYDCLVDNPSQPSIYVIFHDAQAYPEYLIKLR